MKSVINSLVWKDKEHVGFAFVHDCSTGNAESERHTGYESTLNRDTIKCTKPLMHVSYNNKRVFVKYKNVLRWS